MTMRLALMIAATALVSAAASAPAQSPPPKPKASAESCAHRFETKVEVVVDGKPRSTKVRLCGKQGQTDADWAVTLKDAVTKVQANATMPQAMKDQITAALNAEVSKTEAANVAANRVTTTLPVAIARPAERPPQYSTLPPIPTAPKVATKSSLVATRAPAPRKPRITIRCITPGEPGGGGPCLSLVKNTLLTVRADENLAAGTRLRFLRRGNERGEVALAQMRQGQSLRSRLPKELCSGVVRSDVQIQILAGSANQVVDTLGPYDLRC